MNIFEASQNIIESSAEEEGIEQWVIIVLMVILTLVFSALIFVAIAIVWHMRSKTFRKRGYDLFNPKYELDK